MTNKIRFFLMSIAAVLILAGCEYNNPTGEEVKGAGYVLAGYYMMAGEEDALSEGSSRATAASSTPGDYAGMTLAYLDTNNIEMKFVNYPEQGQKTYVTVELYDAAATPDIYLFTSRTEYPNRDDVIDYYLEEYYVAADGTTAWETANAQICDSSGTLDATSRKTMDVHFQDGSVRYEWITDTSTTMGSFYSSFDLDGDMFVPSSESWSPATQSSGMDWSSKVHYYQNIQKDIGWFIVKNKEIFGVRYYTEETGGDSTSLAYETMITSDSISTGIPALDDLANWIFGGGDSGDAVLSETVIRYKLTGSNNKRTTRVSSRIVPTLGSAITIDKETSY